MQTATLQQTAKKPNNFFPRESFQIVIVAVVYLVTCAFLRRTPPFCPFLSSLPFARQCKHFSSFSHRTQTICCLLSDYLKRISVLFATR